MPRQKLPKAQAGEVNYELHSLGWKAFQNLCVTITGEIWGQVVQSYFDSHDGGRDGAFHGTWMPKAGESYRGAFTAQCKFTSKVNKTLHLSDLKDELAKAKRLASRGLADNYILFTNAQLTGVSEEKIRSAFESIPSIKHFAAFGRERISQIIQESSRLRMLVPSVYGLGDLSQILDERAYAQARELLSSLGDDLGKFVITDAYKKSAKAILEHGFVLLLGEPACGKSTIAAALALGSLDEWGCSTVKVRDADEFVDHWNPHEHKQFFWVDDAFGSNQFDWNSAVGWNRAFPQVNAAIRRGARVLFTSRDYIYKFARDHLKESALPVMKESQVVINVENLTEYEREQILYNHIRLGFQPKTFKSLIKPFLPDVAKHKRFSPEIARRLGNPIFTRQLSVSSIGIDDFVEHPLELLLEVIRTLDVECRSALALVFMRNGILPSPLELSIDEQKAVSLLGGSKGGVRKALNALDGSLLIQVFQNDSYTWRLKHPTIRDAFATLVAEDLELMDIYLTGTPIEKLFSEVSCGDVGLEGVKIILPSDRYDALSARIESFYKKHRENKERVNRFLAFRCGREFLSRYSVRNPNFISSLRVGSYLDAVSDVNVIVRLHEFSLLPEDKRSGVVAAIRDLAVDIPDSGFLQDGIRHLFTPEELNGLFEHIRKKFLPNLDDRIDNWSGDYNGKDDPEEFFSPLKGVLEDYKKIYKDGDKATSQIDRAMKKIDDVIEELQSEMPQEPDYEDDYSFTRGESEQDNSRSIFDDVDS